MKAQLPKPCKDADRPLARLQALLLYSVGPLSALMEEATKGTLSPKSTADAVSTAVWQNFRQSCERPRRCSAISAEVHKALPNLKTKTFFSRRPLTFPEPREWALRRQPRKRTLPSIPSPRKRKFPKTELLQEGVMSVPDAGVAKNTLPVVPYVLPNMPIVTVLMQPKKCFLHPYQFKNCTTVNDIANIASETANQKLPFAGRLKHFQVNWLCITKELWVLDTIKGLRIEFLYPPSQLRKPLELTFSGREAEALLSEIKGMQSKQAISTISQPVGGFYSQLFLVPNKDGGQRPVINLKKLNSFVKTEHFKMESIQTLKAKTRRLDGQSRPQRCLLHDPDCSGGQTIRLLQLERNDIPIQLSSFRTVLCAMGLYQDHTASGSNSQGVGCPTDHLHR